MRSFFRTVLEILAAFLILALLHAPLLRLPYFWDEAGYYIPAALDFFHHGFLIPRATLATGHTPLVTVYLGAVWHLFGFSPLVTRAAMILVAAGTIVTLWKLARRVAPGSREIALGSVVVLAVSPLFFAQSSLAHLDLAVALFTTLAVLALLGERMILFALAASLAVLAKETAVVVLPAAWLLAAWRRRERRPGAWIALSAPLLPLIVWALYYHHETGYWTGNAAYLDYNLYSTLSPARILLSLVRRLYEVFVGGFNWLLAAVAVLGLWWGRRNKSRQRSGAGRQASEGGMERARGQEAADFFFLTAALTVAYLALLSVVGGAILPRYLLPIFPVLYLAATVLAGRLPGRLARSLLGLVALGFVASWFVNPPYPFPFEDNLAYVDFIRLHQQAARFLETEAGDARILTAWPASDELREPTLAYVRRPLRVAPLDGFTARDLAPVSGDSFDVFYLYSRRWEPADNWLARFPTLAALPRRYFDYAPAVPGAVLEARYRLRLLAHFERRGQWVRIYAVGARTRPDSSARPAARNAEAFRRVTDPVRGRADEERRARPRRR